eukprot:1073-Hanusia_phi.AAC.3
MIGYTELEGCGLKPLLSHHPSFKFTVRLSPTVAAAAFSVCRRRQCSPGLIGATLYRRRLNSFKLAESPT